MNDSAYLTLAGAADAETRVRGSTFLAHAAPVREETDARALLAERARRYFDATHHCSAFRLHGGVWRADDAGEPSGSAGAPILAAIRAAGLEDCAVAVTRYFGGTKLGVGGLVRAYGEAAALALQGAPRQTAWPALRMRMTYPYKHTSAVMRALDQVAVHEVSHGFAEDGQAGLVLVTVPRDEEESLQEALRELTGGALSAERLEERTLYVPVR